MRRLVGIFLAVAVLLGAVPSALAQEKPKEEKKPPTLWEEHKLFAYIENSYTFNLTGSGRDATNELRLYDFDEGYTFNIAEFSIKKDPSEKYPFGYGLVVTAGIDSQKNHAIGIFRDDNDAFPFRNTRKYDLQEAYVSGMIPVGNGLTIKAGKWVTLLGYEVIESPNNLNFSRSLLFTFAIPLTHVGALASYPVTDWLSVSAGPVVGWDVADDNNDKLSWTGQIAVTPLKDLTTNFQWITGPEQFNQGERRTVFDLVVNYTGIKNLTLGLNYDYGWEDDEASLLAAATRSNSDASWWGWALYAAYDWTERLRTALRFEYFKDADGIRTLGVAAGSKVSLYEVTATVQYKIWRGLVGRLEYRHDNADEKAFKIRTPGLVPTSTTLDTISLSLYYSFF
jgi:hypothetical protein